MSATPQSRHQKNQPAHLRDAVSMTNIDIQHQGDEVIELSISSARLSALLPGAPDVRGGDVGVAMCFLPQDISLRAYAIDAIKGVASERGLQVIGRRDVPVRVDMPGSDVWMRPHVAQFFFLRPEECDLNSFERELMLLQAAIEREMAMLGMTGEDVQVISCSARTLSYIGIGGHRDVVALYPDLDDMPNAPVAGRFPHGSHRSQKFA